VIATKTKPQCSTSSDPCGNACLPKNKKCRKGLEFKGLGIDSTTTLVSRENELIRGIRDHEEAACIKPAPPPPPKTLWRQKGEENSVFFTQNQLKSLKGSIITHNHPVDALLKSQGLTRDSVDPALLKGVSFSPADIGTACKYEAKEIWAVTEAWDHRMQPPKEGWNEKFFQEKVAPSLNLNYQNQYGKAQWDIFWGRTSPSKAEANFWHEVWTNVAKDTGMTYTRTPVKRKDSTVTEAYLIGFSVESGWSMKTGWNLDTEDVIRLRSNLVRRDVDPTDQPTGQQQPDINQRLTAAIKQIIEQGYTDGVREVISASVEGEDIIGQFRGLESVYDFTISGNGKLSYVAISGEEVTTDAVGQDNRNCEKGDPCGRSCIRKGIKCNIKLNRRIAQSVLPDVRKNLQDNPIGTAPTQKTNKTLESTEPQTKTKPSGTKTTEVKATESKPEESKSGGTGDLIKNTAIAMAGIVGVSAAAYLLARERYRSNFPNSAKEAEELSKNIEVKPVSARQHTIIFGVGGLAYENESPEVRTGERLITAAKMGFSRDKGKDFKLVPISNKGSNFPDDLPTTGNSTEHFMNGLKVHYKNVVEKGRNDAAIELAANVIAWSDANPDRQIVMMGHSLGGAIVNEAQELLRIARPDLEKRMVSFKFGTWDGGLTEPFGKEINIIGAGDEDIKKMPKRNPTEIESVKGHTQGAYFSNPDVKQIVSDTIYDFVEKEWSKRPENQPKEPPVKGQSSKKKNPPKSENKTETKSDSYHKYYKQFLIEPKFKQIGELERETTKTSKVLQGGYSR
jgi:hypothetical protein